MENNSANNERPSYLAEGVKPILACIGTREDFMEDPGLTENLWYWGESKDNILVDYEEEGQTLDYKNIKNAGKKTYALSEIDDHNKFSLKYKNCVGIVVSGKDILTFLNNS